MNNGVKETIREALERDEITGAQHLENICRLIAGFAADPNVDNPVPTGLRSYDMIIDSMMMD